MPPPPPYKHSHINSLTRSDHTLYAILHFVYFLIGFEDDHFLMSSDSVHSIILVVSATIK